MPKSSLSENLIQKLKLVLSDDLPGFHGQKEMMPAGRIVIPRDTRDYSQLIPAAVLIALFPIGPDWRFPLIKRVEDGFAHSGQVALPGGRLEEGETVEMAALREAEEEIGLDQNRVRVIGELSPLPIPISGFLVHPVIGVLDHEPDWQLQAGEVDDIFTPSVDALLDTAYRASETRRFREQQFEVPYFNFKPYKVWGATAMILAEFELILQRVLSDT